MDKRYYIKLLLVVLSVEIFIQVFGWLFASQADIEAVEASFKDYLSLEYPILIFSLDAFIIAPLLETLLFQLLIFVVFVRKLKWRYAHFVYYIIAGPLFGIAHFDVYIPSVVFFISFSTAGLLYCWVFASTYDKTGRLSKAYWMTVLMHLLFNTYATLYHYFAGSFEV